LIRLVVLDADGTIWEHSDISSLSLPFKKIDENTLVDQNGVKITLFPGVRKLLKELTARGIIVSMASWNRPGPVFEALGKFGIVSYFTCPIVEFHPNKHEMMNKLLAHLAAHGAIVKPEEILYADDQTIHLEKIRKNVGAVNFLQYGVDISTLIEILDFVQSYEQE